jgi:hypothetical protein
VLCLLVLLATRAAQAEAPTAAEYEVKAAFLFNFVKFVEWPPRALAGQDAIVIGVLGQGPLGATLERTLAGKTVGERRIVARQLTTDSEAKTCHVVFIDAALAPQTGEILKGLEGASVLTVGESERFAEAGGMIGFKVEANKVRFEINRAAAEHAGLHLNSQLLKLATNVIGAPSR